MPQFRKKPVVIEAIRVDQTMTFGLLRDFMGETAWETVEGGVAIPTLEGVMTARLGDWIIKGVAGEYYPCKPDIFDATYEPVASVRAA